MLFTFCEWASHTNELRVRVMVDDFHNNPICRVVHYFDSDIECPSLAEIMQDLISIEYEYTEKQSAKDAQ